jgi:protein kinase C substrate 80K-H
VAWFPNSPASIVTIPPEKINDGYCDCPLDGADEKETGACSGSGMWAGVDAKKGVEEGGKSFFACPQQPSLKLAFSRVNDGICDCCDGADEKESGQCADVCNEVLAAERALRAKLVADYEMGSKIREDSISQYETWIGEMKEKLHTLKNVDLAKLVGERSVLDTQLKDAKMTFSKNWAYVLMDHIPTLNSLTSLVGRNKSGDSEHMNVDDLSSLIISLCWLSGEVSNDHVLNGRCVPFDRASIDVGIMWDHSDKADDNALSKFQYLDLESEVSLLKYAEKIIALAKGNDTDESSNKNKRRKRKIDYDDDDDMNRDFLAEDDFGEDDETIETQSENESEDENPPDNNGPSLEEMVQSRLHRLHLFGTRELFKEQADVLLKLTPPAEEGGGDEESPAEDSANDESAEKEDTNTSIDPIAMNMAKSTISKRLLNIQRGIASAKFATRHIISLMKKPPTGNLSIPTIIQMLAIRMIYHSQISSEDIAEVIYTTSSTFRPDMEVDPSTCPATSPWDHMCPPRAFPLDDGAAFPPDFIVSAANRLCEERSSAMAGVCTAQDDLDVNDFPTSIDEGYYNYYAPKAREESDEVNSAFSIVTPLLAMPFKLSKLISEANKLDDEMNTIKKEVHSLERDMGGEEENKFGFQGELFMLKDTCHTVESGKYEYEVCIFGKATQRDIGQKQGGTDLGKWQIMQMDPENGVRTLKWTGGTKCWNGPQRSAEVVVTCGGSETKLLTADEPETCRYVFTMESPIGCDPLFKLANFL